MRVCEDVPIEAPAGRTVDKTAGEVVPKLIKAADEYKPGDALARLRSTDNDFGTPKVVRSEDATVGAKVSEIMLMLVVAAVTPGFETVKLDEILDDVEVPEDKRGPRPLERETMDASVGMLKELVLELDKGLDVGSRGVAVVEAVDTPLIEGKEPVSIEVAPVGSVLFDVALPTMPGVEPLMIPGVEPSPRPGVDDGEKSG